MSITSIKRNKENIYNKHDGHKLLGRIHKELHKLNKKKKLKRKVVNVKNQQCSEDPTEKTLLPNW